MRRYLRNESGMILMIALWALGLLAVFALYLGAGARQKIILLSRMENRDILSFAAESGIKKAVTYLNMQDVSRGLSATLKESLMNNKKEFKDIVLDRATFDVRYKDFDKTFTKTTFHYGMMDEERKININMASQQELARLFQYVLGWEQEKAEGLALSVVDWRELGESVLSGFFSDEYYENLKYPYQPKNDKFETLDELLLVEGVTPFAFDRLRSFITIYGEGKVNVNTAPWQVFVALGINEGVADKILSVRRGPDGKEATGDDNIFSSFESFFTSIGKDDSLSESEGRHIALLLDQGKIGIYSRYYMIESNSELSFLPQKKSIRCVYDAASHKIIYWSEGL
ncbi:MAG: type II secretion system protein GspK [Candidatus Aceula meridiana]|nr:type II secretion system protein GspK [Candidatus Aceula meridiana]